MSAQTPNSTHTPRLPIVGNTVIFKLAGTEIIGRIVEDRGPIGSRGRQLFRIEAYLDPEQTTTLELPADEFEIQQ